MRHTLSILVENRSGELARIVGLFCARGYNIESEMALIHVNAAGGNKRQQAMHLVDIFRARVIDVSESALTIETTGDQSKVNAFLGLLGPFGIHEMVRAGTL